MEWAQSGFAERLEEALKKRGLTQVKFCEQHGFNRGTLSGWKEKSEPSYEDMYRLAEELDVRPGWLYFNDSFEAADDEERDLLGFWRRMSDAERTGFLSTFKAITAGKEISKKPGNRTKTAPPVSPSPSPELQQSSQLLAEVTEVQKVLADLLEHESVLAVGTKAQISVKNASTLLDRLASALLSKQRADSRKDSGASSPTKGQARAKQPSGRIQADLPLDAPPDAE